MFILLLLMLFYYPYSPHQKFLNGSGQNQTTISYCVVFSSQSFVAQCRKLLQRPGGSAALCVPGVYGG